MTQIELTPARFRTWISSTAHFLPELLIGGGLAANLLVVLLARHFPYQDSTGHLARYVVIQRLLWGEGDPDFRFHWMPTPYIAVDLVGASLVQLFGATAAEKLIASTAVVLPVIGMYLLLRATAPGRRGWTIVAVLISFSWFLLVGLLNLVLGFGLVLCCLAWWWPRRDADGWATPAIIAGMVFGLFFVHLSASLFLLVVLGATLIVRVSDLIADRSPPAYRDAVRLPVVRALLLGTMALIVAAGWWLATCTHSSPNAGGPVVFRSLTSKLLGLVSAFYISSVKQAAFTALAFGSLLLIFLARNGRRLHRDPFFIAAVLSTLLYLVSPLVIGSGFSDIDRRWLLLAYYLPFCLFAPNARPEHPAILLFAFFLCLINTAIIAADVKAIDYKLDDYDTVLRETPRGTRLLPLVISTGDHNRFDLYGQYGAWHTIRNDGRVPGIWSSDDGTHLQHFVRHWHPYNPYTVEGLSPLDWERIAADYDYIILVTKDAALREEVRAHTKPEFTAGIVRLYEVLHSR